MRAPTAAGLAAVLDVPRLRPPLGVEDRNSVVEPRQDIELAAPLVEDEAGGATAAHRNLPRRARHEGVGFELGGREDAHFVGP
jgi:hypothetical protein